MGDLTEVVVWQADDDRIFDAICAGATGYLLKKTQPAQLIESLREVTQGGAPLSPEIARRVVELFREFRPDGLHPPVHLIGAQVHLLESRKASGGTPLHVVGHPLSGRREIAPAECLLSPPDGLDVLATHAPTVRG